MALIRVAVGCQCYLGEPAHRLHIVRERSGHYQPGGHVAAKPKRSLWGQALAMAMMRILHVVTDLNIGGAELAMKRLIESHLDDPCYEHSVISLRSVGTVGRMLREEGVHVEALHLNSPITLPLTFWRLVKRVRRFGPDVVQTWMYHADLLGGLAARWTGCRHILWGIRVADVGIGVARITRIIRSLCAHLSARVPTKIIYVAESARQVHEQLGYEVSKGEVIANGFLVPATTGQRPNLRGDLGVPPDSLLIGSAGRYNAQKDHRSFIRACGEIANEFPNAQFVMLGRDIDQLNADVVRWIYETGSPCRFHLLGERRDLSDCLAALDLFCMHSLYEGLPNVVGEAMATGVPCVVTDVGDAALLVNDTGTVVPPGDTPALANAIREMLMKSNEQRKNLGLRARKRVATHFSMNATRLRFEQIYKSIASEPSPRNSVSAGKPLSSDGQTSLQEQ